MQAICKFVSLGKKSAIVSAISVSITGCSLLDIGESDYGCPGIPRGIKCQSARTVLDSLSGDGADILGRSEPTDRVSPDTSGSSQSIRHKLPNDAGGDADAGYFESSILAPKSLRVKVRPYTDSLGVRHGPQTLTVVIDKWTIRQQEN